MTLLVLKLVKYIGIALFAAGGFSAFFSHHTRQRSFAAHWVTSFGFLLTWIAGYGMMKSMGLKMSVPWIYNSLVASLLTLSAILFSVGRSKWSPLLGALASTGFTFSLVAMTFRNAPCTSALAVSLPLAFGLGFFFVYAVSDGQENDSAVAQQESLEWFWWVARLEGLSLLFLFGVYMPLKYGAKINLDGGQGWVGWIHGVLQVMFVVGLLATGRLQGWSMLQRALALFSSLLPFGTFVFERKMKNVS